jgi:hypothetical protein
MRERISGYNLPEREGSVVQGGVTLTLLRVHDALKFIMESCFCPVNPRIICASNCRPRGSWAGN